MPKFEKEWQVPPVAWLPIACAMVAETLSNALRAYGLGAQFDLGISMGAFGYVSLPGAALILGAVAVSLTQARAAWVAISPGRPARQRILAGVTGTLLLAISIMAMASHILEAQRLKETGALAGQQRHDRAQDAFARAMADLAAVTAARSPQEIRADLDVLIAANGLVGSADSCTINTRMRARSVCRSILALRKDLAMAIRKQDLERRIDELRSELASQRRPVAPSPLEQAVSLWWAWIMGLGVVVIATFGPVIFSTAKSEPDDAPQEQTGNRRRVVPHDRVADWVRTFRRDNGRNPRMAELRERFPQVAKTTAWRRCRAA